MVKLLKGEEGIGDKFWYNSKAVANAYISFE